MQSEAADGLIQLMQAGLQQTPGPGWHTQTCMMLWKLVTCARHSSMVGGSCQRPAGFISARVSNMMHKQFCSHRAVSRPLKLQPRSPASADPGQTIKPAAASWTQRSSTQTHPAGLPEGCP